jgi:nicotinamide riboside kinase/nicotinamide mononucleotide adenylyltransferase
MYKTGVFSGKFLPPHRGHLSSIINSATQCEVLYVIVSDNEEMTRRICQESSLPIMNGIERTKWLSQELQGFDHIKVLFLDESNIPEYPYGWDRWSEKVKEIVPEKIDVLFGGDPEYKEVNDIWFPDSDYILFDYARSRYPISATLIRNNPFKYWDYILGSARPFFSKKVLITGTESCVDGETEFFNGVNWVRISQYKEGESVLQFNNDFSANLVRPIRYIKEKCNWLYKLSNSYSNWSQVYSKDHDIVYVTSKGNLAKKKFSNIMDSNDKNICGFGGKLINYFYYDGDVDIEEFKLRLAIAISADGTISRNNWRIRLKKQRKIERMRYLIKNCGIELDERIYQDGYSNFYIPIEYGSKIFPDSYLCLNKKSKEIFIDEIFRWDGNAKRYYSTLIRNVEIVQFILSSMGYRIHIYKDIRKEYSDCYRVEVSNTKYTTISKNKAVKSGTSILEVPTIDGYKYCFTVPSGMLVLRRDNHIFITGNCSKTTLTKYLAKIFHTSWSEEVGRYYSTKYLGGNESVFTVEDFGRIAYMQYEADMDALHKANKIVFYDTDAVVTQFYTNMYLGRFSKIVESFVDSNRYDTVLMFTPSVKWVADGFRWNNNQEERNKLHNELLSMYKEREFKNIIVIDGDYNQRLEMAISISNELIRG